MDIINLREAPQHLPTLARWHHEQWTHLNPGRTLQQRIDDMQKQLQEQPVPSTWLALDDGQLAGSASLLHADMDTHPELTPWLASVFVAPEFRRRGIASQLVRRAMDAARHGGIDTLYLFTPDQARLYASLGWQLLAKENYFGEQISLMQMAFN